MGRLFLQLMLAALDGPVGGDGLTKTNKKIQKTKTITKTNTNKYKDKDSSYN